MSGTDVTPRDSAIRALPARRMQKKDLVDALDFTLASYVYGMLSTTFVPDAEWKRLAERPLLGGEAVERAPLRDEAVRVATLMQNGSTRSVLVELHRESLKRSVLTDAHEMLLHYTVATGQFPAYKAEPFFAFARVVRNASSARNGGTLTEWPRDLAADGIESVSWQSRTYSRASLGALIRLTHPEALALFDDHATFARERLA